MIFYRQDLIYVLCFMCTCFMFITGMLNIMHMARRSFSNDIIERLQSLSNNVQLNSQTNKITDNQTRISINKNDLFEETYRTFLHSFINNYISVSNKQNLSINYCPPIPPDLLGPLIIKYPPQNFSLSNTSIHHLNIILGGRYYPRTCLARHKVAIIVPYRDRLEILEHFLFHTHLILQRQQLDYQIYICEQAFNDTFNKGIVMNACFKEILKLQPNTRCFIMHDVDLLLIDDRNMYTCPIYPRHLSVAIDKFNFYLPYRELVGGVLAMRREHYQLVNGYSTNYWGWGGEDDDMHARIVNKHLLLERPPASIARYKMLKHTHQKLNPARLKVLRSAHVRIDSDGVNNVKYTLVNKTFYHLYTHFLIDVGQQAI